MEATVYNQNAQAVGTVQLPAKVFQVPMNQDLLYQISTSQLSNKRQVIAHAKGRGEVRGGGRKPWAQKGTGNARHGSIRSPIWKGGGVTFGPTKERNFKKKINKRAARKALSVVLSSKVNDGQILFVDAIEIANQKTKEAAVIMKALTQVLLGDKIRRAMPNTLLIVPNDQNKKVLDRAVRNIPNITLMEARNMNALTTLSFSYVIMLKDSVPVLEKTLSH
ncbi:MAG: 50S ribosomal protein L4 [Candidatus Yanofskybacteria bacterium]|nr:50S ribosomal protein L4 [Candidatus Yanofskybacteria bacterium]